MMNIDRWDVTLFVLLQFLTVIVIALYEMFEHGRKKRKMKRRYMKNLKIENEGIGGA